AQQDFKQGRPKQAGMKQMESAQQMQKAADALKKAAENEQQRRQEEKDRLRDLAQQQKDIEKKTKELAESLKEQSPKAAEALQQASRSMEKASQSMNREEQDEEQSEQTEQEQEQAEEYLDQAREELEDQEENYEDLQQEELLYNVRKECEQLLEEQKSINSVTTSLQAKREKRGSFSRAMKKELRGLSLRQSKSKDRLEEINTAIKEEQVLAFSFVMDELIRDMEKSAKSLSKRKTNLFTSALQEDIVSNLELLLQTIDDEMKARQQREQEPEEEKPDEQAPQKEPLVNRMAELVLLRNMQARVNEVTKALARRKAEQGDEAKFSPVDELMIKRLLHRQNKIKEVFEKLIEEGQAPPEVGTEEEN
ncbi:MAG: hypothetical protein V3W41_18905, partial [Planctomycetota bacterium]